MTSSRGWKWSPRSLNFWVDKLSGRALGTVSSASLETQQFTHPLLSTWQAEKTRHQESCSQGKAWAGNISTYSVNDTQFFELMMKIRAKVKGERIVTYLAEMSYVGYNFLKSETTSAK
jgi:hypothetical protein